MVGVLLSFGAPVQPARNSALDAVTETAMAVTRRRGCTERRAVRSICGLSVVFIVLSRAFVTDQALKSARFGQVIPLAA